MTLEGQQAQDCSSLDSICMRTTKWLPLYKQHVNENTWWNIQNKRNSNQEYENSRWVLLMSSILPPLPHTDSQCIKSDAPNECRL